MGDLGKERCSRAKDYFDWVIFGRRKVTYGEQLRVPGYLQREPALQVCGLASIETCCHHYTRKLNRLLIRALVFSS